MGVSVRMSRNVRVWLPFWVAVPVFACVVAAWVVFACVVAVPWLIVQVVRAMSSR
jgi:hypothetical protein